MTQLQRPFLEDADDLTKPTEVDISAALAPLIRQRSESPIVRPSLASDVVALIDESFPRGGDSLEQLVAQITNATERYPIFEAKWQGADRYCLTSQRLRQR